MNGASEQVQIVKAFCVCVYAMAEKEEDNADDE